MTDLRQAALKKLADLGQEIEQEPVISAWSLREVYFDDDGEPVMHRSPPAAQPEQEPVAMLFGSLPVYDTAAQRPWQGLTDEDWAKIEDMPDTFDQGVAWAQARLKERNNG